MGKGVNKLRYSYHYGNEFYYFITSILGVVLSILYVLFDGINKILFDLNYFLSYSIIIMLSFIIGIFSLKFYFAINKIESIKGGLFCLNSSLLVFIGINLISTSGNIFFQILGVILIIIPLIIIIQFKRSYGLIKIYPNRCYIGEKEFFYEKLKLIKIETGEISIKEIEDETGKKAEIITPISYEYEGDDFTIYHYYIWIETEDHVYIAQSISFRNNMVQNLRNAFYESWRWDGTTVMPEGWEMPDYRSKGLM